MTLDDVSHTMELSGGGGGGRGSAGPSRVSTVWTEETMTGDTPGRECPHDDVGLRPQMDTVRMYDDRVPATNIESPYGGGTLLDGSVPVLSRIGNGRVTCLNCTADLDCRVWGRCLPPRKFLEMLLPVVPAGGSPLAGAVNPAGPDGPVVAGGPVGPCETPSPSSGGNLNPLEHSVLDHAGPVGQHVAVGPVGADVSFEVLEPLEHSVLNHAEPAGQHAAVGMLSPSDCYPAGPAGPYVAGGPVGPDISLQVLEPLEHSVLDHADPAGQHAAVGTLSPSDCYLAGPAGPCVAGGHVGPDDYLQVLEPLEHSVLDHADPAGQHVDVQDTVESLEHSVLDTILEGRPMEGITCPELLECTIKLLDTTLDGGLVEKISDWESVAFGSGVAIGLWTIEIGIVGAVDVGYHSG